MHWDRRDWLILLAITILAGLLRFYQLGLIPPGFQFDEAFNAVDARLVLDGNRPLFLPANAGREVVYTYWQAALTALFGLDVTTLRLASALMGLLAIPASYLMLRIMLRLDSRKIAAFTALVLAISLWHVHFSRYGIRVIMMPVIMSGIVALFWLGDNASTRSRRLLAYAFSGALAGLAVWTHPAGRFVPFILTPYAIWLAARRPHAQRFSVDGPLAGLLLSGLAALLVFLPLGLEFYRHPEFFTGHASEVSIFAERVSGDSPLRALLDNVLHVLGMFSFGGDREWTHNLAGRPVFDWLLAIPFYIGLFFWASRIVKRDDDDPDVNALLLLAIWAVVMLLPSLLSEAAPNYSRTLPALPALFVGAGLGLTWLTSLRRPVPWLGPALAASILLFSTAATVRDYFVRFAQSEAVYYAYDADKLDALEFLDEYAHDGQVYLSQLWGEGHATVNFLRDDLGIKSLDTSDTLVLPPPGQGALYAFPSEQTERAERIAALWLEIEPEPLLDPYGKTLLTNVFLPHETAQGWPVAYQPTRELDARFVEAPTLIGMSSNESQARLTLFWQSDEATVRDLTSFVHLLDVDGQRVGQVDKLPGNGSYPTTDWSPGERVIERYQPWLDDLCAWQEELRVQVGWYEYASDNARRPRADAPGDTALAGSLVLPIFSYREELYAPANRLDLPLTEPVTLVGYDLSVNELQAGSPLRLDLLLHSAHQPESPPLDRGLSLHLVDKSGAKMLLWEGQIAAGARWDPDEVICRRLRLRLPTGIEAGDYTLELTEDETVTLAELTVGETTRRFDLPALDEDVGVVLADDRIGEEQVRLVGIASLVPGEFEDEMVVTLVWESLSAPRSGYKVFVHLLDKTGQIVAQSDAIPGEGYATSRWVSGEIVEDVHRLRLPPKSVPGTYRLIAGMYDPIDGHRLVAYDVDGALISDGAVDLGEIVWPPEN